MKLADDHLPQKLKDTQRFKQFNATSFELENLQYSWINNAFPSLNVTSFTIQLLF